jgi:hypothetical protein
MPQAPKDPSNASHSSYRVAVSGDEAGILKVFAEVAPEVPTSVVPQTEPILERLVASGQSWVAVGADDNIQMGLWYVLVLHGSEEPQMRTNQNEAKMDPQSRRTFLMVALFGAVAAISFGGTGTEAAPNIGTGDTPKNIPASEKVTAGEKVHTVEHDDRVEGAYGYYGRARRVYRRTYRRTRRYVRRAYRRSYYY